MLYNLAVLTLGAASVIVATLGNAKQPQEEPKERVLIKAHYRTK